jgi:hypothetical protein
LLYGAVLSDLGYMAMPHNDCLGSAANPFASFFGGLGGGSVQEEDDAEVAARQAAAAEQEYAPHSCFSATHSSSMEQSTYSDRLF